MGRGTRSQVRQQSEWPGGELRRLHEARRLTSLDQQPSEPALTPIAPHLSVIRHPKIRDWPDLYNWHEVLDDLGVRNRSIGTSRSIGSSAISLVMGREMNAMLQDKYPEDSRSHKIMRKVQHKIGETMTEFLAKEFLSNAATSIEKVVDVHYVGREQVENYDTNQMDWLQLDSGEIRLDDFEEQGIMEHKFGQSTFIVPKKGALQPFGRGYAVDLTAVDQLYQERQELARHCRREHLLDTRLMDDKWGAHAMVFDYHAHIKVANMDHKAVVPDTITFSPPQVLNS